MVPHDWTEHYAKTLYWTINTFKQLQRHWMDVELFAKVNRLQCSWIKNIKFHSCLQPSIRQMKNVPTFNKEIIKNWAKHFSCSLYLPSAILCKFFWFNSNIRTDNKGIFISCFASKGFYLLDRSFMIMPRLNHQIVLNQSTTLKEIDINWYQLISMNSIYSLFT